jgi:hypothetical protein
LYDPLDLCFDKTQFIRGANDVAVHSAVTAAAVLEQNAIDVILFRGLCCMPFNELAYAPIFSVTILIGYLTQRF